MIKNVKKLLLSILISLAVMLTFVGCSELFESEEAKTFINDLVGKEKAVTEISTTAEPEKTENGSEITTEPGKTENGSEITTEPAETEKESETAAEPSEPEKEPKATTDPVVNEKDSEITTVENTQNEVQYVFRSKKLLNQHYEKHGIEMGFSNAKEYEKAASAVINNPNALHKIEKEDGDDVFYVEATNEFAVLSTDGYIRTYFKPDSGKKYFDKQ
ncbi:MAG: hypothetical protein MJ133_06235 [Lachnospiraceae bacterium]|nr:hypothetical protein [Lachnospiraceae bacterium]